MLLEREPVDLAERPERPERMLAAFGRTLLFCTGAYRSRSSSDSSPADDSNSVSGSLARVLTETARPETPDMIEPDSLPFEGCLLRMMPLRLAGRAARFGGLSARPSLPDDLAAMTPMLDLRRGAASESSSDDVLGLRCDVVLVARCRDWLRAGVGAPEAAAAPLRLPARDRPFRGVVSGPCSVSASESSAPCESGGARTAAAPLARELRFDLADLPLFAELTLFRRFALGRFASSPSVASSESLVAAAALALGLLLLLVEDADDLARSRVEPLVWLTTLE